MPCFIGMGRLVFPTSSLFLHFFTFTGYSIKYMSYRLSFLFARFSKKSMHAIEGPNKWRTLVAGMYLEFLAGLTYAFPVYSADLKRLLRTDQAGLSWSVVDLVSRTSVSVFAAR
eukprot:g27776.t1